MEHPESPGALNVLFSPIHWFELGTIRRAGGIPLTTGRMVSVGDANAESFSVKAINTHFRTEGREIGTKTNQRAKQGTISRQFGPPNSDEKSGSFARFMEFLGPRYLEDVRELLGRNTLRRIETEMTKKHKKDRKPAQGQSEFIQLSTMVNFSRLFSSSFASTLLSTLCVGFLGNQTTTAKSPLRRVSRNATRR